MGLALGSRTPPEIAIALIIVFYVIAAIFNLYVPLTGAARTALGPDLPAFFTDDEALAQSLPPLAAAIGDPLWRLPLWDGYRRHLDSDIADMNNVWESPFAGAITAGLAAALIRSRASAREAGHRD